jgi:soluble lytic murein transglycosylase
VDFFASRGRHHIESWVGGMRQVCRSTRTRARLLEIAALVALVSAISSSAPVLRPPPSHLAQHHITNGLQARFGDTEIFAGTEPRETPTNSLRHFFTTAEQAGIKTALESAARHDWKTARQLAASTAVPVARKLIEWRYLLDPRSTASFAELNEFLTANPGWPRRAVLLVRAETSMPASADADFVVDWFGKRQPMTGYGQIRLGEAEIATGKAASGEARIRRAWVEHGFDPATEKRILARHGKLFTAQLQQQRLARMLLDENVAAARRQLPRVQAPPQLALNAQLLLHARGKLDSIMSAVQPTLSNDPRLLMMLSHRLEDEHRPEDARRYLWRAVLSSSPLMARDQLWPTIRVAARDALADRNYDFAYQLVSHSGLQPGADYVEAEFMAGWLALQHLKQPQMALKHFEAVRREATLPATLSRSEYWLGRACEAMKDKRRAIGHYRLAAEKGETFYGQLATVRLSHAPTLRLKTVHIQPSVAKLSLGNDERAEAARILSAVGERDLAREFASRLVEETPSLNRFAAVIGLAEDLHDPALSLRVAKEAERRNLLLPNYLHPVVNIPQQTAGPSPDPAVVLSIIRQESEFDRFAESGAGARGLMQLLPGTAKEAAEHQHVGFDAARLGSDANYNIRLGESTLASYMRFWSNSTLLAVASYNAGPGTVKKWVATFGDPRGGQVDPIDWIESIPFGETRTYVERVLAGTQVYRLRSKKGSLAIVADLRDSSAHASHPASSPQVRLAAN